MEKNDKQENRPGKLVAVFTTWDNVEAGFIQSLLQANDIECMRQNLHLATISLLGSGAAPIKILVEEKDEERAKDIVNQYYQDLKEEETENKD